MYYDVPSIVLSTGGYKGKAKTALTLKKLTF